MNEYRDVAVGDGVSVVLQDRLLVPRRRSNSKLCYRTDYLYQGAGLAVSCVTGPITCTKAQV